MTWNTGPILPSTNNQRTYGYASVPYGNTFLLVGEADYNGVNHLNTIYEYVPGNTVEEDSWHLRPEQLKGVGSDYPTAFFVDPGTFDCH